MENSKAKNQQRDKKNYIDSYIFQKTILTIFPGHFNELNAENMSVTGSGASFLLK